VNTPIVFRLIYLQDRLETDVALKLLVGVATS